MNETEGLIFHSSNENSEKFYTKILNKKDFFKLFSIGLPLTFIPFKKYGLLGKLSFILFKLYLLHLKVVKNFKNRIVFRIEQKMK